MPTCVANSARFFLFFTGCIFCDPASALHCLQAYKQLTPMGNKLDSILVLARSLASRDAAGHISDASLFKKASDMRDLGFDTTTITYATWVIHKRVPALEDPKASIQGRGKRQSLSTVSPLHCPCARFLGVSLPVAAAIL